MNKRRFSRSQQSAIAGYLAQVSRARPEHSATLPLIETERLYLRPFKIEDAHRLFDIYRGPDVLRYISEKPPQTIADVLNHLTALMRPYPVCGFRGMFEKETKALVGRCGIVPRTIDGNTYYSIAYLVAREFWNRGYATEAARKTLEADVPRLKLERIVAVVNRRDQAAQSVARKLGLTYTREAVVDEQEVVIHSNQQDF